MRYSTPEKCGIRTEDIKDFIDRLEYDGLATHSLIIMRGDAVILEKYWAPFNRDFCHRLYSVTKSFVALAIGFLADEGRVGLDDPISRYFPAETEGLDGVIRDQTVREMLMMRTAYPANLPNWFTSGADDRVLHYFHGGRGYDYPSGTLYRYDSNGSFVLGALVERVTGKPILDYLNEKLFSHIGVEGAYALSCPGGHSWMDSALLMRPIDLAKCARFVMDGGRVGEKQLLSYGFIKAATSLQAPTTQYGERTINSYGYGYQFWLTKHNSYFFNGMGCQLALCCPERDLIMVYNGDNQGNAVAKDVIFNAFFDTVYKNAAEGELCEYSGEPLCEHSLFSVGGAHSSVLSCRVSGVKYLMRKNSMGITDICVTFEDGDGILTYTNGRGKKEIPFGIGKNSFGIFPESGYSHTVGGKGCEGHAYKMAASGAWQTEDCLLIRVQIIDEYFGNLSFMLSFKDKTVSLRCMKCAENFLSGYDGYAFGTAED